MADDPKLPRELIRGGIIPGTSVEREIANLRKRYPSIDSDLERELAALAVRNCLPPDDPIPGSDRKLYKRRARCSDSNEGKSGGYRIVYGVFPEGIALLRVYHKRAVSDIPIRNLMQAFAQALEQLAESIAPDAPDASEKADALDVEPAPVNSSGNRPD